MKIIQELRTPIQPILSITQILRSRINDSQQQELLEIVIRNAKRLNRLSDEILDVTKLETQTLELKKEQFNLNDAILNAHKRTATFVGSALAFHTLSGAKFTVTYSLDATANTPLTMIR